MFLIQDFSSLVTKWSKQPLTDIFWKPSQRISKTNETGEWMLEKDPTKMGKGRNQNK